MLTSATPGTRSSCALISFSAITDWSMMDRVFDETPISMMRLVADLGGMMVGGAAQFGRVGRTMANFSCTSSRARKTSVPSLKIIWISESWDTDWERITSRPATPFSACSSGVVTTCSTSAGDRPTHSVWISTVGGANSGNTSTGVLRTCEIPPKTRAAPMATTRKRNFRLDATIQRIMAIGGVPSLVADAGLDAGELRSPDHDDRAARRRTVREDREVPDDVVDRNGLMNVEQGRRVDVGVGVPAGQIEHCGVRHHPPKGGRRRQRRRRPCHRRCHRKRRRGGGRWRPGWYAGI